MMIESKEFIVDQTDSYKKTALVLHSLSKTDRNWLLDNLPAEQKSKLQHLLTEISDIGIEPVKYEVSRLIDKFSSNNSLVLHKENELGSQLALIDKADWQEVQGVLVNESVPAIALVLAVGNWSWSHDYMGTLSSELRNEVRELVKGYVGNIPLGVKEGVASFLSEKLSISV